MSKLSSNKALRIILGKKVDEITLKELHTELNVAPIKQRANELKKKYEEKNIEIENPILVLCLYEFSQNKHLFRRFITPLEDLDKTNPFDLNDEEEESNDLDGIDAIFG